jgi:hypothetical protein
MRGPEGASVQQCTGATRLVPQVLGQHPVQVLLIDDQELCVPKTSSTLCNQAVFVDQATNSSLFLDAVVVEIDRFG